MHDPYEDPIERPEIPTPTRVALKLPAINLLKARSPLWIPPVEQDCLPFLGGIGIAWGGYEQFFVGLLRALLDANRSTDRWAGISYDRRRVLFRRHMNIYFRAHPLIVLLFKNIITDSLTLQFKRNMLLHGKLSFRATTKLSEGELMPQSTIIATIRYKGQYVTDEFDRDKLEDLYYALLNLAGRLNRFSSPISLSQFPHFSLRDISALQDFLHAHYRPPSMEGPPLKP